EKITRSICYRNVSFAYNGTKPILDGFNFSADVGKRYLIKGPSGCGKTTAVNLLLRYYDVTKGSIEIDGAPITDYESTYDCVTVVRQEAVLFHDTLRNNLTMFRDISDEKLIEVLNELELSKFANAESLDESITENGSNLSGGEKKRICLARALLRDTDVLILDEPLANLDEATAKKIEDILLSIKGKLLLVVSHQFTEEKLGCFDGVLRINT
ncbi:MAG: ABC transporter ATP-binding protein, partial [Clostridia bacterium]|nr:ABC transporter ATP-binding protein [Clostridia bacterium]